MHHHQPLLLAQQVDVTCGVGLNSTQFASRDEKMATAAVPVKQSAPSRFTSAGSDDEWVIVGSCWSTTVLPRSELAEFQRGNRDFIAWGVGIAALIFLAAMLSE